MSEFGEVSGTIANVGEDCRIIDLPRRSLSGLECARRADSEPVARLPRWMFASEEVHNGAYEDC
jgi:hypothetical protein